MNHSSMPQPKPPLWLIVAPADHPEAPLAIPTLAWMARQVGAAIEQYLEAPRDGKLFARTGSTVLGGRHHEQLNYVLNRFDVRLLKLGATRLFASTFAALGLPALAGDDAIDLYRAVMSSDGTVPQRVLEFDDRQAPPSLRLRPYLLADICFGEALGVVADAASADQRSWLHSLRVPVERRTVAADETYQGFTGRSAQRWADQASGVAFGDPDAILGQAAWHCANRRIALFGERLPIEPAKVRASAYVEVGSSAAELAGDLAVQVGNPVIVGRQMCDADILTWSRRGCCIQITDPNRPPFPAIDQAPQTWSGSEAAPAWLGPDDATLEAWADQKKILATLVWHSGELAHNEAMLNLIELASTTRTCMGIGVHAQRYAMCPQTWEMLNVPVEAGGAAGLIEPVLHSGGRGVLAEALCPADALGEHCRSALEAIGRIAGRAGTPTGYYCFLDTDLATLTHVPRDKHAAIAASGLSYVISSARPGRSRVLGEHGGCLVLNQSPRVIHPASPFVRITGPADLETAPRIGPAWMIATLDAPVRAFGPYIWRRGGEVTDLIEAIHSRGDLVSATPHTIARYARILQRRGALPTAPGTD